MTTPSQIVGVATPKVRVLLATYNGVRWLDEQLRSIFEQTGVDLSVVVSDDSSTDETAQCLAGWAAHSRLLALPNTGRRFGSAHRNFLRLILEAPLGDADFVALADQDDVWLPAKLQRAVHCLHELPADAYSSDVIAFWPDGRRQLIRKSHAQRRHDYLFGSPGPGCTFVLPRAVFDRLRAWVSANHDKLQAIWVHDWLIYAYVRGQGLRWHIDTVPNMLYRQHGNNEIGVNAGWRAAYRRWSHVRSGSYRADILAIADSIADTSRPVDAIRRLNWADRLWLIQHVMDFRRRTSESLALAVMLFCMPKGAET